MSISIGMPSGIINSNIIVADQANLVIFSIKFIICHSIISGIWASILCTLLSYNYSYNKYMKKLTFEQSKQLMQIITLLLELGIIDLKRFAALSINLAEITILDKQDYLQMVLELFD